MIDLQQIRQSFVGAFIPPHQLAQNSFNKDLF